MMSVPSPGTPGPASPAPSSSSALELEVKKMEERMMIGMKQQEHRFQQMFQQVMAHMESMPRPLMDGTPSSWSAALSAPVNPVPTGADVAMEPEFSEEEIRRMSIEHRAERRADWEDCQYGNVLPLSEMLRGNQR